MQRDDRGRFTHTNLANSHGELIAQSLAPKAGALALAEALSPTYQHQRQTLRRSNEQERRPGRREVSPWVGLL